MLKWTAISQLELDDGSIDLHWQGKFRGPDFPPISFELQQVTHQDLKDRRGRLLPTVVARHLSDTAKESIAKANDASQIELLKLIAKHPKASLTDYANMLGWKMKDGQPYKMRAKRIIAALEKAKLIKRGLGRIDLAKEGEKALTEGQPKAVTAVPLDA